MLLAKPLSKWLGLLTIPTAEQKSPSASVFQPFILQSSRQRLKARLRFPLFWPLAWSLSLILLLASTVNNLFCLSACIMMVGRGCLTRFWCPLGHRFSSLHWVPSTLHIKTCVLSCANCSKEVCVKLVFNMYLNKYSIFTDNYINISCF